MLHEHENKHMVIPKSQHSRRFPRGVERGGRGGGGDGEAGSRGRDPFKDVRAHSRPQRPRTFWSAPRIATSGLVQRHSVFE